MIFPAKGSRRSTSPAMCFVKIMLEPIGSPSPAHGRAAIGAMRRQETSSKALSWPGASRPRQGGADDGQGELADWTFVHAPILRLMPGVGWRPMLTMPSLNGVDGLSPLPSRARAHQRSRSETACVWILRRLRPVRRRRVCALHAVCRINFAHLIGRQQDCWGRQTISKPDRPSANPLQDEANNEIAAT